MNVRSLLSTPIDNLDFAVVDTETTGMYCEHNRIMDIGIVKISHGEIVLEWETLIDPQQEVPYWITKFTNITTKHVKGKPTFDKVSENIKRHLDNTVFVAHNVGFDYWFLYNEMRRLKIDFDYPKLCTVLLGRKLLPTLGLANLDILSDYYNIQIENRHRALPDAKATALIFIEFLKLAKSNFDVKTFFDLEKLQKIKIVKPVNNDVGLFSDKK